MVAEIGRGLVAHFLGRGFAAVLRDTRVVLHAHPAHVQLGAAGLALLEAAQRQRQRLERGAALPAGEAVTHETGAYGAARRSCKNSLSTAPVCEVAALSMTAAGGPQTTTLPPPAPASGPMSMIQSASAMTSRLCSTTTTVLPASTSRCSTWMSFSTSAMCRPTVGSSSTYNVCGAFWRGARRSSPRTLASSVTSLMRCASPPDSVGEGWPSVR